jgi:GntR family transcriptional regulator/MocR family aminotransferase
VEVLLEVAHRVVERCHGRDGYAQDVVHRAGEMLDHDDAGQDDRGLLERGVAGALPQADVDDAGWLVLEPWPGESLRAALRRVLRDAIGAGALRAGVRLPASRVLARHLGVSRGVVSDAYAQLKAEGFVIIRARSAPLVAAVGRAGGGQAPPETAPAARYDLTPTTPDVTVFPARRWLAAYEWALRQAPYATLDYREPRGERALREVLADHLGRTRGVIADPAQIVVVQGTAQGIDLLLRSVKARGATRIAVEDPSHPTQHERVRAHSLELAAQPIDAHGVLLDGLDADALLVTPAHQFPIGCVLSADRRRLLLGWAASRDALIVEDDYDAEFRYDRQPARALQGLAPEHVVQLGSVSKTLAPAIRLGWVIAPPTLVDSLEREKRLVDDFSPALDQLALARLIANGDYARHLRRARRAYHTRRDALISALAAQLPELTVEGIAAGVHLLLRLPHRTDDTAIAADAATARILTEPLSRYFIHPTDQRGLVIGYGRLHESAVPAAAKALAHVIHRHL